MFKKFLILLLIPVLLFSAELSKKLTFSAPYVSQGKIYMQGCNYIREPFAPSVVQKGVCLLLPVGHKAVSYTVSHGEPVALAGTPHYLKPYKQDGRISFGPPEDYYTRSAAMYDKNEFYPNEAKSEFFTTQYKNGIAMFVANVKPVQYNPVTGELRYYPYISVHVTTEAVVNAPTVKFTPLAKSLLSFQVDNPEALEGIPFTKPRADAYQYLIVTTDALKDAYSTFIEFNARRGLKSQVQTMEWIKSNSSGTDDPDKLRNYIKDQYDNNDIVFVLLGADDDNNNSNDVPHRGLKASMYDYGSDYYNDNDIAADMYFSCLDGDWKGSNQYYGEFGTEDIGWEVYASRFPVDNATELTNMVNKTIKYSEQPVAGEVNNHLNSGEFLWGPPDHPVECYGKDCMVQNYGTCTANNYTTTGFTASEWNTTELFDKDQNWSKSTFFNKVNDDKIAWIDHVGHSNTGYIMKCYTSDITNSNLQNNGTNANFFLATTWGCYPGSFDNRSTGGSYGSDCIAEAFTAGIANGAVAFWSNTRYGLGDDGTASADGTDGSNHRYERWFHDAIFNKMIHYIEMMNAYAKEQNKDLICESDITKAPYYGQMKYTGYETCILGDPALSIWTATPQQLTADHPTTIAANATSFSWDTKKAYTTVALLDGARGDIIAAQITGEDGKCEITGDALTTYLAANPSGKLGINVKAHNFLPYSGEIQISGTGISSNINMSLKKNFLNGRTNTIAYSLSHPGRITIAVYDSKGALVKTLANGFQSAGDHSIPFSSKSLSNGIYYLRMTTNSGKLVEKFVITK